MVVEEIVVSEVDGVIVGVGRERSGWEADVVGRTLREVGGERGPVIEEEEEILERTEEALVRVRVGSSISCCGERIGVMMPEGVDWRASEGVQRPFQRPPGAVAPEGEISRREMEPGAERGKLE